MKMLVSAATLLALGYGCALGQSPTSAPASAPATAPATPSATAPAVDPTVTKALQMLQDRGLTLKEFEARLRYQVLHTRDGTTEVNRGLAAYLMDTPARVAIVLEDLIIDGNIADKNLEHQFVFDGKWLIERDPKKKIFRKVQVAKAGSNPFKLRGPLPMPIGQKVADVLADFAVTAVADKIISPDTRPKADKALPADVVHLQLTPRKADAFDFAQLDLWVDPATQLPLKLVKEGLDGNTTTIWLSEVLVNKGGVATLPVFNVKEPAKSEGWYVEIKGAEK